jgi:putative ABC transport system permease protein
MGPLLRSLRTPLSAAVVLTLALAIGANTAVFGVVDAVLLRPPPFDDVDRLVIPYITRSSETDGVTKQRWSYPRFELLRRLTRPELFEDLASFSRSTLTLTDGDSPEPVDGEVVSPAYFRVLAIRPVLGRSFTDAENLVPGANPVVIIGDDLWHRRFAGDRAVLGRTLGISGTSFTIVGVLPPGFRGLTGQAAFWIPAAMAPVISYDKYLTTNQNFVSVIARLRPGVDVDRLRARLLVIGAAIQLSLPTEAESATDRFAATALPLDEARIDSADRRSVALLLGAVGFLLLLACANVANLSLARVTARQRELAIRSALGATRTQLARAIFAESILLAIAGGGAGALLAAWLLPVMPLPARVIGPTNMYGSLGDFAHPSFDWRVLVFVAGVSILAACLCGALPALQPSRLDLVRDLKTGSAGAVRGAGLRRLSARSLIVALETALALVLLIAGALMVESFRRLRREDLGFETRHLLTFWLRPPDVKYPPPEAAVLMERVLAEIARVPGVVAATVDGCAPVGTGCANSTLYVIGRPEPAPDDAPGVLRHYVAPDHFKTLGVPLVRGRLFTPQDRAGRARVAIINSLAARRFFANEDPIGKRVWFGGGSNFDRPDSAAEIVGIVGDVAYQSPDMHRMQPDFYTPYLQFTYASRMVLVRAAADPAALVPALRRAVRNADADLPLYDVRTMDQRIGDTWAKRRFDTLLLAAFALVAILLAAMGIYAVVAHSVAQRTREIGIRVALGATIPDVVALVIREGMTLPLAGLAVGIIASLTLTRALRSMLYGVSETSPVVFGVVTMLLGAVAFVACYLPARRVVRVDPLIALKTDA